jgi:hypothetical protein
VLVTEQHYNPWIRSRQEQLEADVTNAGRPDPVLTNDKISAQIPYTLGRNALTE